MAIVVNGTIDDIPEPGKNFCIVFFFPNEVMNDQSSSHTFCLPPSFEKKKRFLKKKKGSIILISTIILLNLTFSLINYKKGASTIINSLSFFLHLVFTSGPPKSE